MLSLEIENQLQLSPYYQHNWQLYKAVLIKLEHQSPTNQSIIQILFKMKPETLSDKPKWDDIEAKVEVGQGGVPLPNQAFGLQLKTCVKMDKPENMKLGGFVNSYYWLAGSPFTS